MALVKVNDLEKNQVEMEFTIDKEAFDKACFAAYKKNVGRLNVPGFRRGKAPKGMIEKLYGKAVFFEDALEMTVPNAFDAAVKEAGLKPVGRPEYDVDTVGENGASIKAKFYVYPAVEIKDYKGIEVERHEHPVTDEMIDAEIERVRTRNAREIEVTDRPARKDDVVVIDYEGYADGKKFDGGTAQDHNLKLGSGQFIPGFEDQIIGHSVGDSFDVNVKFPDEYHAEDLKGKEATFKTTVKAIKFDELPELDDEFAKDVSEFDTFAEYKADVKAKLEEEQKHHSEQHMEEEIADKLCEKLEGEVPPPMIDTEAENMLRDYDTRLRMQGLDLNTYVKYADQSLDDLRGQFKPQAERQVKTRLALEKIAELEGVKVEDAEVDEEIEKIAKAYGMEVAKVKELVTAESISEDIKVRKALDIVKGAAKIVEGHHDHEKKPAAKKPAAKKPAAKKPAAEKADDAEKKPAAKKPAAKKPAAKKPAAEKTDDAEKKPAAKKPAVKKPAAKKPAAAKSDKTDI